MIRNKYFRNFLILTFAFAFIIGLSIDAEAQRRSRRSRTAAAKKKAAANAMRIKERRKGAEDVAIQIKNATKFVFVLGGIATGIEDIDKEIKAGKASRELKARNTEFKGNVIRSIRALRAGLVKLEVDFRSKAGLKPYLKYIRGIIGDTAQAEDLALAGNFRRSGQQLLLVVETLADVLVEMP